MNRPELKTILQNAYDRSQWISTLQFLTGKRDLLTVNLSPIAIDINTNEADRLVQSFHQIGNLKTSDGASLPIFEIILKNGIRIEQNRVGVNEFIKKYIVKDAVKGALTTFSYDENREKTEWRFSFISKNSASDFFAEAVAEETNPKKYTYIFGNKEEHRTAIERLYNLEQSRFRLEDFFEAFNVEPVSKKFFDEYKGLYKQFSGFLADDKNGYRTIFEAEISDMNNKTKEEVDKEIDKHIRNFVSRLMGRMVFLYFLQKKHWLGASNQEYNDGSSTFLSDLFYNDKDSQTDFYKNYLSKIFFKALNKADRKNEDFTLHNGKTVCIPFLNGGLFEEEQEPNGHEDIQFPAFYFEDLFKFFNGYNFTIYENSPEEHTIAVDPEMLGHIFENLIDYNKDTGTFYTPKEIVQYMTQESLIEYLNTHLQKDRSDIENIVKNQNASHFENTELIKINRLLDDVKICDPAIGSGAFPMGMLQEIFNLKALINFKLGFDVWSPATVKQNIIQNSIYGVDLDEGAVEIARLRFWLTLVVDEGKPKPLPNLSYKILVGNSVVNKFETLPVEIDWSLDSTKEGFFAQDIIEEKISLLKKISTKQNDYFFATGELKYQLHQEITNLKLEIISKELEVMITSKGTEFISATKRNSKKQNEVYEQTLRWKEALEKINSIKNQEKPSFSHFDWALDFPEVLNPILIDKEKRGFDIVIGNPPYIKEYTNKSAFDGFRSSLYYIGKMDIWYGFASKGFDILKEKGVECFIAQNNWITSSGASILRKDVLTRTEIKQFIDFGDYKVFQSAGIQTMIYLLQKIQNPSEIYHIYYAGLIDSNINKNQLEDFLNTNKTLSKDRIFEKYQQNFIPENFIGKYISFSKPSVKNILNIILKNGNFHLENFEATNGIHSHHDYVSKSMLKNLENSTKVNDGIFALSESELERLNLFDKEKALIKPYYSSTEKIEKFIVYENTEYVIYTDSSFKEKNKINEFPNLKKHLNKFIDVITSDNKPYGLHRSRNEDFFIGEKIISVRKCIEPTFAYSNIPSYFSATFYIIKSDRINLKYLTTFLNSKIVYYWLKNEGKMQGNNFQVDKDPLLKIPIYKPDNYSPFLELFELITITLQSKESIIEEIENKHIANFFQEIVDAYFFEIYFPEEMQEKNITVTAQIEEILKEYNANNFENLSQEDKRKMIASLYYSLKESEVQKRMRQFVTASPDVLKVILQS